MARAFRSGHRHHSVGQEDRAVCKPISNPATLWIWAIALAALAGCEATSHRVGQSTNVQFGVVQNAQEVQLESNAAAGALIGGTIGLLASGSGSSAGGAIAGAAVGGTAAAVAEGSRKGVQYTVRMMDGSSTRIVSDQREIMVNDCVAIERGGRTANIRRTSAQYCQPAYSEAVNQVSDSISSEASQCQDAKQELADAKGQQAVELAVRKVELLCNS